MLINSDSIVCGVSPFVGLLSLKFLYRFDLKGWLDGKKVNV